MRGTPPARVTKTYGQRGPLRQLRLEAATRFWCFRCGREKKSKLWTLYEDDWGRVLCNGCYGRLLSIFNVKAGTAPTDEKAEQLAGILLQLWTPVEAEAAFEASIRSNEHRVALRGLSSKARRFIGSAERLAEQIGEASSLDWSGVVIGYCKAVELEAVGRVVDPLCVEVAQVALPDSDVKDKDIGRVAAYCASQGAKPPELGAMRHFLATAAHSEKRAATSPFLKAFRALLERWPESAWLIDDEGCIAALHVITVEYRNRAAHLDELSADDFQGCKSFVMGDSGLLPRLISATSP